MSNRLTGGLYPGCNSNFSNTKFAVKPSGQQTAIPTTQHTLVFKKLKIVHLKKLSPT